MIGTPNRLDLDKASTFFFPTSSDKKTVKTLLKEIAAGGFADWAASTVYASGDCVVPTANNGYIYRCTTAGTSGSSEPTWGTTIDGTTTDNTATWTCKGKEMTCFRHTTAYTVTFDSDDSLIDAFIPADQFRINLNGTRLDAMKRLIAFTKCMMRVEDDEEIHIYQPTTTGTTYNYEYKLNVTDEHNFIAKGLRRRIVVPNYIQVDSHPDTGDSYTGFATDSAALEMRQYWYLRPASNAQATSIAEAILEHYKLNAEQGSATIPILNCGQEVLDYIKITGPTEVGDRVGNVEYINRTVDFTKAGQFLMTLSYGDMPEEPHKREPQEQIDNLAQVIGNLGQVEVDRVADTFHVEAGVVRTSPFAASDDLQNSNDTTRTVAVGVTMVKIKEVKLKEDLSACRLKFDMLDPNDSVCSSRVYRNGTAIGTLREGTLSNVWVTYSEDFINWFAGDLIQIYGKRTVTGENLSVRNMRFYYDKDITHIGGEDLLTNLDLHNFAILVTNQDP